MLRLTDSRKLEMRFPKLGLINRELNLIYPEAECEADKSVQWGIDLRSF